MHLLVNLFHYVWSTALVLSVIVFVHEFGHFIVARLCGVKVETFSIGFGRELIGRTDRHGTRWKFSLIPLGGYVKMFGDSSAASTPDVEKINAMGDEDRKRSLHHQRLPKKAAIVAAGPIANFLLTIAIFTYFIYTVGINSTEPVIGEVVSGTPAAAAGLKADDRILTVDGKRMEVFTDIAETLITNLYKPVTLEVERGQEHLTLSITPAELEDTDLAGNVEKRPWIGIRSKLITRENVSFPKAVWYATDKTYTMCVTNLVGLRQIITGERSARNLTGTLGIAKLSGDVTRQGTTAFETLMTLLYFIAVLSAGIGMVNLFPLPILDGGHLLFYAIEALRGRPASERFMEYSFRLGFVLIIMLFAFSVFNDARKIFFS